jgi:hypothetical protein
MKLKLLLIVVLCLGIGFWAGRATAPKPDTRQLHAMGVDCYDAKGNLVKDKFSDLGGVTIACGPDQIPRLHQSNPPEHIDVK